MAAVVLTPETPAGVRARGQRIDILPGASTPAVFAAGTPFWIGYGFVPSGPAAGSLDESTRFELALDGRPVSLFTDLEVDGPRTVGKVAVASFDAGLGAGWHRFAGRWYVADKLVLTSDTSIEFVEP
jgi:hypothetical protein